SSDYTPFPVNFWEFRNLLVWNAESILITNLRIPVVWNNKQHRSANNRKKDLIWSFNIKINSKFENYVTILLGNIKNYIIIGWHLAAYLLKTNHRYRLSWIGCIFRGGFLFLSGSGPLIFPLDSGYLFENGKREDLHGKIKKQMAHRRFGSRYSHFNRLRLRMEQFYKPAHGTI
ncbi:hypothetical protein, partial [Siminovitchia sp. 179-K 8D1 HS]|uniref:hypothetical protein n=1 Tax=Siminovitchia sp. 179-K 8D1 HS TaxID=3142385 RepID=UPI0039A1268B